MKVWRLTNSWNLIPNSLHQKKRKRRFFSVFSFSCCFHSFSSKNWFDVWTEKIAINYDLTKYIHFYQDSFFYIYLLYLLPLDVCCDKVMSPSASVKKSRHRFKLFYNNNRKIPQYFDGEQVRYRQNQVTRNCWKPNVFMINYIYFLMTYFHLGKITQ